MALDRGFLIDPEDEHGHILQPHVGTLASAVDVPCLVLLGEPGLGKSTALEGDIDGPRLLSLRRNLNLYQTDVALLRGIFEDPTFVAWRDGEHTLHLYLDSLDECLVRVQTVANLLAEELRCCPVQRLRLRIACRTAAWPASLEDALRQLWGEQAVTALELCPLRRHDVAIAAESSGVDAPAFLSAVDRYEAGAFAAKPVTLRFLLAAYRRTGAFPSTQSELYLSGCERLCEEANQQRQDAGLRGTLTPRQRLVVAARIASLLVLCGRPAIWTGVNAGDVPPEDLMIDDLAGGSESLDGGAVEVTEREVREVLDTGLFSSRGAHRIGFAHQTYAEFLAGHFIARRTMGDAQVLSLITHAGDDVGRIVPQLQETAAWVATLLPRVREHIMRADPQVLLGSDAATMSPENRAALVDSLLRGFTALELIDTPWEQRSRYRNLAHPRLGAQLGPVIRDRTRNRVARRVAIDIAEACNERSLEQVLAAVALDVTDEQHVREQAAHAVVRIGSPDAVVLLRPCVFGQAGDDPQDELKGVALRVLWPHRLTPEELFGSLTPPKQPNFFGAYKRFIDDALLPPFNPAMLPAALHWVAGLHDREAEDFCFRGVLDAVLQIAWERLEEPGVLDPYAEAVADRLLGHKVIPGLERARGGGDDDRRRLLAGAVIRVLVARGAPADALVHTQTPLLFPRDLPWLVARLRDVPPEGPRTFYARLARAVYRGDSPEHLDAILSITPTHPEVEAEFAPIVRPVDINSEEASALRSQYRKSLEFERQMAQEEAKNILVPPPCEWVAAALRRCEAGELDGWWQLNRNLTLVPHSTHYGDELESDLTALPGWREADEATREQITAASQDYLARARPDTCRWLGRNVIYYPDFAAYRAFRLLQTLRPELLDALRAEVWTSWAAVILGYPTPIGMRGDCKHQDLVRRAYRHAPGEVVRTLDLLIDAENRDSTWISIIRKMEQCWDDRVVAAMRAKVQDLSLKPSCMESLLEELLKRHDEGVVAFALALVTRPIPPDGPARARAISAAALLLVHMPRLAWSAIWSVIEADGAFGREILLAVAGRHDQEHAAMVAEHITEDQVADLYLWLVREFPPAADPKLEGAQFVGPRTSIAFFRDAVLQQLRGRGTQRAWLAVQRLARALPELSWLPWVAVEARSRALACTWTPPSPSSLLRLSRDSESRLVESPEQLLAVVIGSLHRLQQELQGETPAAPDLWNRLPDGKYRPKDEGDLSNYVARHFRKDLRERGIVANREVEIRRGEGDNEGERTDIHIDAVMPGPRPGALDTVSVVVEVKGCWNAGVKKDMQEQLCDRYLRGNRCRHGLYLVGWFLCDQWDKGDARRDSTRKKTAAEMQAFFDEQAAQLSGSGVFVRAAVLDIALR
jgi:hypothetical protein